MNTTKKGYTLVEVLLVVGIIGLLASIMTAGILSNRDQTDESITKANLENLRIAIVLFKEYEGQWPADDLSDLANGLAPSGKVYMGVIPHEQITNSNVVSNVENFSGGWYWNTVAREVSVNLSGQDSGGVYYNEY